MVCAQHEADPLRPKVMAFYSVSQSTAVPTELIDLRHSDETVVAFENAADWGYSASPCPRCSGAVKRQQRQLRP